MSFTMSKAAERSNRTSTADCPVSVVNKRSLKTFKRADSVLWRASKSHLNTAWMARTVIKNNFLQNIGEKRSFQNRSKIGQNRAVQFFFFLSNRNTTACLREASTAPEVRLPFMVNWILGSVISQTFMKQRSKIISVGQSAGLSLKTMSFKTGSVTGSNWRRTAEQVAGMEGSKEGGEMYALMFS